MDFEDRPLVLPPSTKPNVFLANQSNLSDEAWSNFEDNKHISTTNPKSIPLFAKNLKEALRNATNTQIYTNRTSVRPRDMDIDATNTHMYTSGTRVHPHDIDIDATNTQMYTNRNSVRPRDSEVHKSRESSRNKFNNDHQKNSNEYSFKTALIEKLNEVMKCIQMSL